MIATDVRNLSQRKKARGVLVKGADFRGLFDRQGASLRHWTYLYRQKVDQQLAIQWAQQTAIQIKNLQFSQLIQKP